MSLFFGKCKTPSVNLIAYDIVYIIVVNPELLRENKRMLDKSIREIERERQGLQTQEKKLIAEIKKSAKQGQMGAVKVMAKDLVRTRHQIEKFYKLKSQLQGVSLRIQTLKSTQAMGEAMKGVTKAMGQMNRQMNLPSLQKIMQEFMKQNEKMELMTEVMEDAMDDALEGDEEEEETEELVSQVLDEIGINMNQELVNAPSTAVATPAAKTKIAQAEATGNDDGGIDSDLQARLDNLRRM
ncbi:Vacuolar protein sorting-associated protein 2-like 1, partial [Cucurbita argyrosperma subsp. argyrosperma]